MAAGRYRSRRTLRRPTAGRRSGRPAKGVRSRAGRVGGDGAKRGRSVMKRVLTKVVPAAFAVGIVAGGTGVVAAATSTTNTTAPGGTTTSTTALGGTTT